MPGADDHPALRVHALCVKVACLWPLGRASDQPAAIAEAETAARANDDRALIARALRARSHHESNAGRLEAADALAQEALRYATASGDQWEIALASQATVGGASDIRTLRQRIDGAARLLSEVGALYQHGAMLLGAAYLALRWKCDADAMDFIRRAVPVAQAVDSPYMWMILHGNFGLASLFTGDTDAADQAFGEELRLCRALVVRPIAAEGLRGLAAVATLRGDTGRAARLIGAASAHADAQQAEVVDARLDASYFDAARQRHGAPAWDDTVHARAALTFEDAIGEALREPRQAKSDASVAKRVGVSAGSAPRATDRDDVTLKRASSE